MKKFHLSLVLALVCCMMAFAACGTKSDNLGKGKTIDDAKAYYRSMYREFKNDQEVDFELVSILRLTGDDGIEYVFNVDYTLEMAEGSPENLISYKKTDDGSLTVFTLATKREQDYTYKLSATISDAKGSQRTYDFGECRLPKLVAYDFTSFKNAADANATATEKEKGCVIGYVTGTILTGSSKGSIYFVDANGDGFFAHKPDGLTAKTDAELAAEYPIGTHIMVTGTPYLYTTSGQYEFDQKCSVKKIAGSLTAEEMNKFYKDATADWGNATNNKDTALIPYQNSLSKLENAKFTRKVEGTKNSYFFMVNGVEFAICETTYFMNQTALDELLAKFEVGKQATIKGIVALFSNEYQIYPLDLDCISNVQAAQLNDKEKVAAVANSLTLEKTTFSKNETITLPNSLEAYEGVEITWDIKAGTTQSSTLSSNTLNIVVGSATEKFTLVATVKCNNEEDTKEIEITVIKSNSFVAQAIEIGNALENEATTEDEYMLVGKVSNTPKEYKDGDTLTGIEFTVTDLDGIQNVTVYKYNLDDMASIKQGSFIALRAKIKKFNSTIEFVAPFTKLAVTEMSDIPSMATDAAVTAYGQISQINTKYNSSFDNITVTLTDGNKTVRCFRLKGGEDLQVGMYIFVTGKTEKSNGHMNIGAGATYVTSSKYVASETPEKTDQEKVDELVAKVNKTVSGNFNLDTLDNTVTWTSSNTNVIAIDGANAVVTRPAAGQENATVTLTAELNGKKATVDVTVLAEAQTGSDEGTEGNPFTVAQVITASAGLAKDAYYKDGAEVWLTGYVKTVQYNSKFKSFTIDLADSMNSDVTFLCYSVNTTGSIGIYEGEKVTLKGYIKNFNGTIELAQNSDKVFPTLVEKVKYLDKYTVTSKGANATVKFDGTDLSTAEAANGAPLSFTIEVASGYTLSAVKLTNGAKINETLTAGENGKYTFQVEGNMTITVETLKEGTSEPQLVATVISKELGYAAKTDIPDGKIFESNGVTISIAKGTSATTPRFWSDDCIRIYHGATMTIASSTAIKKIVLTVTASDGNTATVDCGTLSSDTKTWTGSSQSITFTVGPKANGNKGGHLRISKIEIYC